MTGRFTQEGVGWESMSCEMKKKGKRGKERLGLADLRDLAIVHDDDVTRAGRERSGIGSLRGHAQARETSPCNFSALVAWWSGVVWSLGWSCLFLAGSSWSGALGWEL